MDKREKLRASAQRHKLGACTNGHVGLGVGE